MEVVEEAESNRIKTFVAWKICSVSDKRGCACKDIEGGSMMKSMVIPQDADICWVVIKTFICNALEGENEAVPMRVTS